MKSVLIKDLVNDNISLESALQRLRVITYSLPSEKVQNWLRYELNGYAGVSDIPAYRQNMEASILYSGINGRCIVTNQPLPLNNLSDKVLDLIKDLQVIKDNVRVIESTLKEEFKDKKIGHDLTFLSGYVQKETGIQCTQIIMEISLTSFIRILSTIKNRMIEILLDLENEFGCLDSMDIDIESKSEEEISIITKKIENHMYSDNMKFE